MAVQIQNPVIVVAGMTASNLRDEYATEPEPVWSLLRKSYDRVALHPDNLQYERDEPARVAADRVFDIPSDEFIRELRHDLTRREDEPTPVYPFCYDWRQPLERSEASLAAFVDEVIERTKLMPHYNTESKVEGRKVEPYVKDPKVDLVGHSMGGVIIAGFLQHAGSSARVGKVATLGSPFRGSLEAPLKVTTGLSSLGTRPSSREREFARLTPALYHLLPSFEGAVTADAGLPDTLFNAQAWQPSIIDTLAEYIRLHGLRKTNRKARARQLFEMILGQARDHRRRIESFTLRQAGLQDDDWLCIVGVGEVTRVRMRIKKVRGKPEFDLTSRDRVNLLDDDDPALRVQTGDGTVPYKGARCGFVPTEKIVCVRDDDFGYWEVGDRLLEGAAGLHGLLPKMNLIHRLVVSHFTGKRRKGVWGRRPPDLPPDRQWRPPIERLEEKR